jgi:hypothetical protein
MTQSQSPWLQCGEQIVYKEDLPSLIVDLSLLPLFLRRLIERQASHPFVPTPQEQVEFQQLFLQAERINDEQSLQSWLDKSGLTEAEMSERLYRSLQLEQFKLDRFSRSAEQYFLQNKSSFDRVIYSLIRTEKRAQSVEIHLRLEDEDATFSALASEFSQGFERNSNGQIGPMELGAINPALAERLRVSKEGQLWSPFELEQWWVILRLEKMFPAKYDASMRRRLVDQLYEDWMLDQVKRGIYSLKASVSEQDIPESLASDRPLNDFSSDMNTSEPKTESTNIVSALFSRFRGKT